MEKTVYAALLEFFLDNYTNALGANQTPAKAMRGSTPTNCSGLRSHFT